MSAAKKTAKTHTAKCLTEVWVTGTFPVIEDADGNRVPDIPAGTPFQVVADHGDTMELEYPTLADH